MNDKSNLTNFLNDLTDQELSVFIKYQYASFLFGSKEKIDLEVQKRGLSEAEIEKIGKVKLNKDSGENINIAIDVAPNIFLLKLILKKFP